MNSNSLFNQLSVASLIVNRKNDEISVIPATFFLRSLSDFFCILPQIGKSSRRSLTKLIRAVMTNLIDGKFSTKTFK